MFLRKAPSDSHSSLVYSVAWSPDSKLIASELIASGSSNDKTVMKAWDVHAGITLRQTLYLWMFSYMHGLSLVVNASQACVRGVRVSRFETSSCYLGSFDHTVDV